MRKYFDDIILDFICFLGVFYLIIIFIFSIYVLFNFLFPSIYISKHISHINHIPKGTIITCLNCHTKLYKCVSERDSPASSDFEPVSKNIPQPVAGSKMDCPVCGINLWGTFQSYVKTKELK